MSVMYENAPEIRAYPMLERTPIAWVTWLLAGSTIAVFLLQLACLHLYGDDVIGNALAFSSQSVAEHHYWTVVTYAWAHAVGFFGIFWLHIVANMIPLICLGPALEQVLGHARFLGLYIGGAIAAALVWYFFNSPFGADDAIIGASGAVYAIIAAIGVAIPHVRVTVLLFFVIPLRMSMGILALVACGVEAASILFGWMPEIAHSAHLGGAAFGALYVLAVRWLWRRNHLSV